MYLIKPVTSLVYRVITIIVAEKLVCFSWATKG